MSFIHSICPIRHWTRRNGCRCRCPRAPHAPHHSTGSNGTNRPRRNQVRRRKLDSSWYSLVPCAAAAPPINHLLVTGSFGHVQLEGQVWPQMRQIGHAKSLPDRPYSCKPKGYETTALKLGSGKLWRLLWRTPDSRPRSPSRKRQDYPSQKSDTSACMSAVLSLAPELEIE